MAKDSWPQGAVWRLGFASHPWGIAAKAIGCKEDLGDQGFLATQCCLMARTYGCRDLRSFAIEIHRVDTAGEEDT
ncbi:hypothetical protein GW17_00026496 [Ensete ventricosum]|nr:hypothetical protein GW17_00026496 [Ensete ventricosum]